MNLFAYGTLMDRRIMFKVIGRTLPTAVPATLHGFRKYETTLGYPVILPEAGATTSGLVFFSLTTADWKRLDDYEGVYGSPPAYFRRLMTVQGAHGSISCNVYVGNLNHFRTRLKL
ncbi:MAG TPA: gamma-glutamylcyclotransferase family protein [Symbiobacteriaceae bacterium]|nr:gamma-glutamylcyclotransferase family protein [Symbiobacteriaceae bacterium]